MRHERHDWNLSQRALAVETALLLGSFLLLQDEARSNWLSRGAACQSWTPAMGCRARSALRVGHGH
jgi:hypothetical protein